MASDTCYALSLESSQLRIYQVFTKVIASNIQVASVTLFGITDNSIPAIEDCYENYVLPMLDKHFS